MGIIPSLVEPGGSTVFICYSHYDTSYIPDATVPCTPLYAVGTSLVTTAINEEVGVYPSPVVDILHVNVPATGVFEGTIYNAVGQLMWTGAVEKSKEVWTQNWPSGIYLLRLQGGGVVTTQRIVK
jgi:hypothetical protein